MSWSGGKDSALALHALLGSDRYEVAGLLTTVTAEVDRISMHGVRRALLDEQAAALRLPLVTAEIPPAASNDDYVASMGAALVGIREAGITHV
ncbi:MAG: ATP-binding protein, partial [Gemmatimonadetes bacterium]|nr:ATP-binding protein [Gemmatimonadota bacterium]